MDIRKPAAGAKAHAAGFSWQPCIHIFQVDFFRNVVVASRTKGKRNREIPMDVLDDRVKPILLNLCENKKADEFVFVNPKNQKALHGHQKGVWYSVGTNSETSNGMI